MTDGSKTLENIQKAKAIISSGSLGILDQQISRLIKNQWTTKKWLGEVFVGIIDQMKYEYASMNVAYSNNDPISVVAWRARNLLEICIWTIFCTKDEENARQFYDDAARDFDDILRSLQNHPIPKEYSDEDFDGLIANGIKDFRERAIVFGVNIDQKYTKIKEVFEILPDLKNLYLGANKQLSKFVHPTALSMIGLADGRLQKMKEHFFDLGCLNFVGIFEYLKTYFETILEGN